MLRTGEGAERGHRPIAITRDQLGYSDQQAKEASGSIGPRVPVRGCELSGKNNARGKKDRERQDQNRYARNNVAAPQPRVRSRFRLSLQV